MGLKLSNDFIFKYVFGREENLDILLDFVNAVLVDSGFTPVVGLSLKNPVNLRQTSWLKETVLDIKATDAKGHQFDIEIQVEPDAAYAQRSLFYWAQVYANQLNKGDDYSELKPVVCINILDFTLFSGLSTQHHCFMLHEIRNKDLILTEDLAIHFIELPKKQTLQSRLTLWTSLIDSDPYQEDAMTILFQKDPLLNKAQQEFQRCTEDEELRELALSREKYQLDISSKLGAARREGKLEGKLETARQLKSLGVADLTIREATGLSNEEIERL